MMILMDILIAVFVIAAGVVIKTLFENYEDDAFDAELTAISNEKARQLHCLALQERG